MILFRLIGLFFDLLLLPLRAWRRSRALPAGAWLALTIDGPVADVVAKPRFWQVRAQKATSLHGLAEAAVRAAADVRVRGIVVTLRSLSAGMASATSLHAILSRLRAAGKEVVVHLPMGGGTKETFVASAATKILLGPRAQLAPLGFLTSTRYVRSLLDRAGIKPEIFACGEYKSAGETLVRDSMSDAQREQLGLLVDGFHRALVSAIAEGRGVTKERAAELVDRAPYFGVAAVEAGLADAVAYEDEVPKALGLEGKASQRSFVELADYVALGRPLLRELSSRPAIAVIRVHGPIAHASGPFGQFATDERVARAVRLARLNRRVVGAILHVDSPGGSALASDLMHHEIVQLAREKPVVTCMANVAASGGYYVAAPTHRIVCEPTTVTGSIGVVAARLSIDPLLERLGVTTETVKRGGRAGLLSPTAPLDEDERVALARELDATYDAFVGVVSEGRKIPKERTMELARGRVYTGEDALAVGLVDVLGGFDVALRELRALLDPRVRDRAEPRILRSPRRAIPVPDLPSKGEAGRRAASAILGALMPAGDRCLVELASNGERVLALGPIYET